MPYPESTVAPSPARCVRHGRPPPPASRAAPRPAPYALLSTRQGAHAFNQPLSFDITSKVTYMLRMFWVRSSPCPAPNLQSSPPLHAACATVVRRLPPPGPHLAPHRMPSFRQDAQAFNQPLSFDTSSVTNMEYIFHVRSSPCPAPNLQSRPALHAACAAVARRLPPPNLHLASHRMPSFRLSAAHILLVQRQQAAHSLRVGGHLGPRLCWTLRLELGSGKLLNELSSHRGERDWAASAATTRSTPARNLHVAEAYTDMRGEGVNKRLRRADNRK
eukprot:scaffold73604_cov48-Phaeocystis_antarctica.AAC.1